GVVGPPDGGAHGRCTVRSQPSHSDVRPVRTAFEPRTGARRTMSMINYASREINCKIVYYGTGLGGKTTNLEQVYARVNPETRGKMISLATETDRTLFFDFLPIDLGSIRGFKTRFHLYT